MVYSWFVKQFHEQEALDEWLTDLEDLLPWQDAVSSEAAVNLESESFLAMQAKGGR